MGISPFSRQMFCMVLIPTPSDFIIYVDARWFLLGLTVMTLYNFKTVI